VEHTGSVVVHPDKVISLEIIGCCLWAFCKPLVTWRTLGSCYIWDVALRRVALRLISFQRFMIKDFPRGTAGKGFLELEFWVGMGGWSWRRERSFMIAQSFRISP